VYTDKRSLSTFRIIIRKCLEPRCEVVVERFSIIICNKIKLIQSAMLVTIPWRSVYVSSMCMHRASNRILSCYAPFTRYNATGCHTGCTIGLTTVLNEQLVRSTRLSNRVVQPHWQPAAYTIQPVVSRLYRVNGALKYCCLCSWTIHQYNWTYTRCCCVTGVRILGHFARIPFHFCSRLPNVKIPQLLAAGKLKGLFVRVVCVD